jgi:hypothetical protein
MKCQAHPVQKTSHSIRGETESQESARLTSGHSWKTPLGGFQPGLGDSMLPLVHKAGPRWREW